MPIRYAIRSELAAPLAKKEIAGLKAQNYSVYDLKFDYENVSFKEAKLDEANGVYAVFSNNGMKLSDWILMKESYAATEAKAKWAKKPSQSLEDAIGQELLPGDYVLTEDNGGRKLELSRVVHVLKSIIIIESFAKGEMKVRRKFGSLVLKIPSELIMNGATSPEKYEKRYAIHESEENKDWTYSSTYHPTDGPTAQQSPSGVYAYFNSKDEQVTGWVWNELEDRLLEKLNSKTYQDKELVETLPVPLIDALGADIKLGDFVFSTVMYHHFMLCEVVGFTKDKVLLLAYLTYREGREHGQRLVGLNAPKTIVKFPISF